MSRGPAVLYLASRSPRRLALLRQIGLNPEMLPADVDESPRPGEDAPALALRLAQQKALRAQELVRERGLPAGVCLGADTVVALGSRIFGKAADEAGAVAALLRLSGRWHAVLSGVAVIDAAGGMHCAVSRSRVRLRAIAPAEARRYWAGGEPQDKAGSYAIQGLGAVFVERLDGSYSGVMGLPLFETAALLQACGMEVL